MEKEKVLLDLEYEFICDFIKLRKEKGLTNPEHCDIMTSSKRTRSVKMRK